MEIKERLDYLMKMELLEIEPSEIENLVKEMLIHVGSTDAQLRDKLIYSFFAKLINRNHLTTTQMHDTLLTCLDDEHLFFGIGEKDTDTVFTRSFSTLVMALIVENDVKNRFLSPKTVLDAYERTLIYLSREVDYRGFVEEKGWAHSVAHGADLLDAFVKHPFVDEFGKAIEAIEHFIMRSDGVFIDNEDERLAFPILEMVNRGLEATELNRLIEMAVLKVREEKVKVKYAPSFFHLRTNVSNFLKTLYFRLKFKGISSPFEETLEVALKSIHEDIYGS